MVRVGAAERDPDLIGTALAERDLDRLRPLLEFLHARMMGDEGRYRDFVPSIPFQRPVAALIAERGLGLVKRAVLSAEKSSELSALRVAERRYLIRIEVVTVEVVITREVAP